MSVDSVELSCVLSVVLCRVVTADTANVTLPALVTGALIGRTNLCWNCVSQYKRFLQIWNRSQSYLAWILYIYNVCSVIFKCNDEYDTFHELSYC